jgi:thiosulfate dehydrogenase [quinone] large subunit
MSGKAPSKRSFRQMIQSIEDPPWTKALFGDVRWSWIWLILRVYAGWQWLQAGWEKLNSPTWVGSEAGQALGGFIQGALAKTGGSHPDVQGWYAWFLEHAVLPGAAVWSYVVTIGECLVGIALILGLFTAIAAFFGAFMNANYLLAGSVSINPFLLVIAVFLILAWKTGGWWGLDRWALPALGTPWRPGFIFRNKGDPSSELNLSDGSRNS